MAISFQRFSGRCGTLSVVALGILFHWAAVPSAVAATNDAIPACSISTNRPLPALLEMAWQAEAGLSAPIQSRCRIRFEELSDWIRANLPENWGRRSQVERAAYLLAAMHQRVLTGSYQADQHTVSGALLSGDYNCLSASILYQALAQEFGIPLVAVQSPRHVWCRVLSVPTVDVETTCPQWFTLSASERSQSPIAKGAEETRVLTPGGLVAKIPYNLAANAAAQCNFSLAVRLLERAQRIDPQDSSIRKNRLATLNNWAVWHLERGEWAEAVRVTQRDAWNVSLDETIPANRRKIIEAAIHQCCQTGEFQKALQFAQVRDETVAIATDNGNEKTNWTPTDIYEQWIVRLAERQSRLEAENVLRLALSETSEDALAGLRLKRVFRRSFSSTVKH